MNESTKIAFELKALIYAQSVEEDISRQETEDLANKMLLMVDSFTFDEKRFTKAVVEGMPVEQCDICIQMFLTLLQKMSERDYDARNEAAHTLACSITQNMMPEAISDDELPACVYAEFICISHRTLQQSLVRLWVELIYEINTQMKKMSYTADRAAIVEKTDKILNCPSSCEF